MRRRVLLVVVLILAMLLQCVVPFTTTYAEENVGITFNSKLYTAVKKALRSQGVAAEYRDSTRTIVTTQSEIDNITSLDLSNGEIDDLAGLDVFKNLIVLDLHANELTVDSNLAVIDSLSLLRTLDLSSNKLESVKSISNFKNIAEADITNQRIKGGQIITVDTSDESASHEKTVLVDLPDILYEDPNGLNPYWVNIEVNEASGSGKPMAELVEVDGVLKLRLTIAEGVAENFKALKGLVRIDIKVEESSSKLHNTQVEYYFVIVDQDEIGIIFKDENCYKAVKEQLTHHQTVNEELTETQNRNLYERYYDDELMLVIKMEDIYNNITSLILHDKMIEDLTGIENFVGLKSNLDISHNYIDSALTLIELELSKSAAEKTIKDRYQGTIDELKVQVADYDSQMKIYDENTVLANEAKAKLAAATEPTSKEAIANEMQEYLNKANEALKAAERHRVLIEKYTEKLYKIYKKEYMLISLLPLDVNDMSYEDIIEADAETIKAVAVSIMERISNFEQAKALTPFEKWAIEKELKEWGNERGWEFSTQKKIQKVNPGDGQVSEAWEPIEFPFTEFFDSVKQDSTLSIGDFEKFVYIFKAINTLSQIESYSLIERTFGTDVAKDTKDWAEEALTAIKEEYELKGIDDYFINRVKKTNFSQADCSKEGAGTTNEYLFDSTSGGLVSIKIALGDKEYSGKLEETEGDTNKKAYKLIMAHRLNIVTPEDMERYIYLPRIHSLNISHNNIETLEGLDGLSELRELYAWHNGLNDITVMNWENFVNLEVLDLGYNQISDISPLEVLVNLKKLDVSNNLLSGRFSFNLINMEDLTEADFSHNQYNDIAYLATQFRLRAMGSGKTVPKYLKDNGIKINFQYQELEIKTTVVKSEGNNFIEVELPLIFRQLEELDNENTSFGYSSREGLVDAKGEHVTIPVPTNTGEYTGRVTVEGRNGYEPGYTEDGIGYGTFCDIKVTVTTASVVPDVTPNPPVDPNKPNNPNEDDPGESENPEDPGTPVEYGYEIVDNYVVVYTPETLVADFMRNLVDSQKYNAIITENDSNNISTGATVTVTNKTGDKEYGIFEIVVKGDVNGDGYVNAHDSGIIKNYINAVSDLVGSYFLAGDVNGDGKVDSLDSMEVLQYRASRIDSFERNQEKE